MNLHLFAPQGDFSIARVETSQCPMGWRNAVTSVNTVETETCVVRRENSPIIKSGLRRCNHEWARALRWRLHANAMKMLLATAHHDGNGKFALWGANFPGTNGDAAVASSGGVGVGGAGVGVGGGGAPCEARCFDKGGAMAFSEVFFEVRSCERRFADGAANFRGDAPRRVRSQLRPRSGRWWRWRRWWRWWRWQRRRRWRWHGRVPRGCE
jgi:hypothetical protein